MKKLLIIPFLLIGYNLAFAQEVPYHISNTQVYEFLDELASLKIITINSAIKPYSRKFIAEKLKEATEKKDKLNRRQKKELDFYLKEFVKELNHVSFTDFVGKSIIAKKHMNPNAPKKRIDLFYYKDSLFNFTFNPILGLEYFTNENKTIMHRWNGLEGFGYIGKHWGLYANLRDNRITSDIVGKTYLVNVTGIDNKGGKDYSEMRGGLVYSWNWGSFGLMKDHFAWGNNYNGSNIFSGRTPSFTHIKFSLHPVKWLDFNYVHGWLNSEVLDSLRTYKLKYKDREVFYEKYIAANMYTIRLWKHLNISLGNSIVYSSYNVNPAYLIPFIFYKSVDHTLTNGSNDGGSNAQIFFDISSRNLRKVHLYTTFFIDEVNFSHFRDKKLNTNWIGGKAGIRISNLPGNVILTGEYTRTNPMVYKHYITTTDFESNNYNLGHYLRDNAQEYYIDIKYKPIRGLLIDLSYVYAEHGPDVQDDRINAHILGVPFMEKVIWKSEALHFKVGYEIVNSAHIYVEYINSKVTTAEYLNINTNKVVTIDQVLKTYTPEYLWFSTNTINFGVCFGF
jgi:hypothetical protein